MLVSWLSSNVVWGRIFPQVSYLVPLLFEFLMFAENKTEVSEQEHYLLVA